MPDLKYSRMTEIYNFSSSFPRCKVSLSRSCIFVMSNLITTLISLIECLITFTMVINKDAHMACTKVSSILGDLLLHFCDFNHTSRGLWIDTKLRIEYIRALLKLNNSQEFPGGPVVRIPRFHCRGHGVPSLVGELRSRMPRGQKEKKKRKIKQFSME